MQTRSNVVDMFMHRMAATADLMADMAHEALTDDSERTLEKLGQLAEFRDRMRRKAEGLRRGTPV